MDEKKAQVFTISGLTCGSCEKMVSKRLMKIEGVTNVQVTASNGLAVVSASRQIALQEVTKALEETHYSVINNS